MASRRHATVIGVLVLVGVGTLLLVGAALLLLLLAGYLREEVSLLLALVLVLLASLAVPGLSGSGTRP